MSERKGFDDKGYIKMALQAVHIVVAVGCFSVGSAGMGAILIISFVLLTTDSGGGA